MFTIQIKRDDWVSVGLHAHACMCVCVRVFTACIMQVRGDETARGEEVVFIHVLLVHLFLMHATHLCYVERT